MILHQNNICTDKQTLVFFGVHSNSFIQRCPSITLRRNNVFHSLSKNYFPALRKKFVGLVESSETSKSEPSTFSVMNIPKKPQAVAGVVKWGDSKLLSSPCLTSSSIDFMHCLGLQKDQYQQTYSAVSMGGFENNLETKKVLFTSFSYIVTAH